MLIFSKRKPRFFAGCVRFSKNQLFEKRKCAAANDSAFFITNGVRG